MWDCSSICCACYLPAQPGHSCWQRSGDMGCAGCLGMRATQPHCCAPPDPPSDCRLLGSVLSSSSSLRCTSCRSRSVNASVSASSPNRVLSPCSSSACSVDARSCAGATHSAEVGALLWLLRAACHSALPHALQLRAPAPPLPLPTPPSLPPPCPHLAALHRLPRAVGLQRGGLAADHQQVLQVAELGGPQPPVQQPVLQHVAHPRQRCIHVAVLPRRGAGQWWCVCVGMGVGAQQQA